MSLTEEEQVQLSRHLGYEITPPYSDYVVLYLHPAYTRIAESDAALSQLRDLLSKANTAWEKYNASLTKQELESAGSISFSKQGEKRLLATYRNICREIARALNVNPNFPSGGKRRYKY